ncbi:hypothetical protein [Halovivax cerinus]|uniref:DUF2178 domain-containing protein n=1 Tax=Halovivax cerinus TaxID=1487865 RepID=A0ABD5NKQ0_9EURY|nr:hypothetical protein [Halovivax cerinus]
MVPALVLAFLFSMALFAASAILLAWWIYIDATQRGADPAWLWAVATVALPVVALAYLVHRRRLPGRTAPMDRTERLVGTMFVASSAGILASGLAPPDPITQSVYSLVLSALGLALGYALVWRRGWSTVRPRLAT